MSDRAGFTIFRVRDEPTASTGRVLPTRVGFVARSAIAKFIPGQVVLVESGRRHVVEGRFLFDDRSELIGLAPDDQSRDYGREVRIGANRRLRFGTFPAPIPSGWWAKGAPFVPA